MLKPTFSSLFPKRLGAGWTCARCRSQAPRPNYPRPALLRQYGTTGPSFTTPKPKPRRRAAVLLATAGGGAAAMLLSVGDDVKNSYEAIERTGRVASTLVLCINE
jgi:aarF domain-containing kinase